MFINIALALVFISLKLLPLTFCKEISYYVEILHPSFNAKVEPGVLVPEFNVIKIWDLASSDNLKICTKMINRFETFTRCTPYAPYVYIHLSFQREAESQLQAWIIDGRAQIVSNIGNTKFTIQKNHYLPPTDCKDFIRDGSYESVCMHTCGGRELCSFQVSSIQPYDCIFISTTDFNGRPTAKYLYAFGVLKHDIKVPFSIVTHSADLALPDGDGHCFFQQGIENCLAKFSDWLESPFLHKWYASNCNWNGALKPTKLRCIPIGMRNDVCSDYNQNKTTSTSYKIQQHSKYQNLLFQSGADTVLGAPPFRMPGRFFIEFGEDLDCFSKTSHSAESWFGWKGLLIATKSLFVQKCQTLRTIRSTCVRVEPVEMQKHRSIISYLLDRLKIADPIHMLIINSINSYPKVIEEIEFKRHRPNYVWMRSLSVVNKTVKDNAISILKFHGYVKVDYDDKENKTICDECMWRKAKFPSVLVDEGSDIRVLNADLSRTSFQSAERFFSGVKRSLFVLCNEYNSIRKHCVWSVLAAGSIPVVRSSKMDTLYAPLPILVVKHWEDLTKERMLHFLSTLCYDIRSAQISHWRHIIVNDKPQNLLEDFKIVAHDRSFIFSTHGLKTYESFHLEKKQSIFCNSGFVNFLITNYTFIKDTDPVYLDFGPNLGSCAIFAASFGMSVNVFETYRPNANAIQRSSVLSKVAIVAHNLPHHGFNMLNMYENKHTIENKLLKLDSVEIIRIGHGIVDPFVFFREIVYKTGLRPKIVVYGVDSLALSDKMLSLKYHMFENISTLFFSGEFYDKVHSVVAEPKPKIAICIAAKSRQSWLTIGDSSIQSILIPSIMKQVKPEEIENFDIHLYVGIDYGDLFMEKHYHSIKKPVWLQLHFRFFRTEPNVIPFNMILAAAYNEGADYFIRVNDDTEFLSPGFITVGIEALARHVPVNVGVVGPCDPFKRKRAFMVHDMVHKTHFSIFQTYYPTHFSAWYIDIWITNVYKPNFATQLKDWVAFNHNESTGATRYSVQYNEENYLRDSILSGQKQVRDYVDGKSQICKSILPTSKEVISQDKYFEVCDVHFGFESIGYDFHAPLYNDAIICVKGDSITLQKFFGLKLRINYTLITLGSKEYVPQNLSWIKTKEINKWYGWNSNDDHIISIPIGSKAESIKRVPALLSQDERIDKVLFIYDPQSTKDSFFDQFRSLDFVEFTAAKIYSKEYFDAIAKYRYIYCDLVDIYKIWDVFYTGGSVVTSPQVSKMPHVQGLPVIEVDLFEKHAWRKVVNRSSREQNYTGLYFSFWRDQILSQHQKHRKILKIHVLTMNRAESLSRLLWSLEESDYEGDQVALTIHVDGHKDNKDCINVINQFKFSHGKTHVNISKKNLGLRNSWFNAWKVPNENERAVILEDDIELSPLWYRWLKHAWIHYGNNPDLAGISLQRQTLIPDVKTRSREIVNENKPFLYALVGSIGFSPNWWVWQKFLSWVKDIDLDTVNVDTHDLITLGWFNSMSRRNMWTQYFIYFCRQYHLYTLYVNLPNGKTLAANHREKGVHTAHTLGNDFPLARKFHNEFPQKLRKYGWKGELISICKTVTIVQPFDLHQSLRHLNYNAVKHLTADIMHFGELLEQSTGAVIEMGFGVQSFSSTDFSAHRKFFVIEQELFHIAKLCESGINTTNSNIEIIHATTGEQNQVNLDSIINKEKIAIIRINMNGYNTINGMKQLLQNQQPLYIILSNYSDNLKAFRDLQIQRMKETLKQYAYNCNKIDDSESISCKKKKKNSLLQIAAEIQPKNGLIYVMFLNDAYVEMTLNWICNIKNLKDKSILDQTLFIVTSVKASMAIKDALPNAHIHMRAYDISSVESYGTYSYFRLTVERLSAQNELIQNGMNVVIIEADAYWSSGNISSLIHTYLSQDYDIVSADNGHDHNHEISAGLLAVKSTNMTRSFFNLYLNQYIQKLASYANSNGEFIGDVGEQHTMTEMLKFTNLKIRWLSKCEAASGLWYKNSSDFPCLLPMVINNNYIIGYQNKIERAKAFEQWFVKNNSCVTTNNSTQILSKQKNVLGNKEGNEWIYKQLKAGKPFAVVRMGLAESCLVNQFINNPKKIHKCAEPHKLSGIYPETEEVFTKFAEMYFKSMQLLDENDAIASFVNLDEEKVLSLTNIGTIMQNRALEPFYFENPWSRFLQGKTVLIVHPFIDSIKCQLRVRSKLFRDGNVLPPFKAKFVKMYQAIAYNHPHGSYFETLEAVKGKIDDAGNFDIALIAAGGYSLPLSIYCKTEKRATSIIMGGGSQILFGLKGSRWDTHKIISKLYNSFWIYPLDFDTPENSFLVEDGCYWGKHWQRIKFCPHNYANSLSSFEQSCFEKYKKDIDSSISTEFAPGKSIMMDSSSVKMICDLLTPSTRVLEWGSGGSTIFFSQFSKYWTSIEHDVVWAEQVRKHIDNMPLSQISMHVVPVDYDWKVHGNKECVDLKHQACESPLKCKNCTLFSDYVQLPLQWEQVFDIVLIDGRARVPCAHTALQLLSQGGLALVHDWERPWYKTILQEWEIVAEDTTGLRHLAVLRPRAKITG